MLLWPESKYSRFQHHIWRWLGYYNNIHTVYFFLFNTFSASNNKDKERVDNRAWDLLKMVDDAYSKEKILNE